jgi:hypothetical protein
MPSCHLIHHHILSFYNTSQTILSQSYNFQLEQTHVSQTHVSPRHVSCRAVVCRAPLYSIVEKSFIHSGMPRIMRNHLYAFSHAPHATRHAHYSFKKYIEVLSCLYAVLALILASCSSCAFLLPPPHLQIWFFGPPASVIWLILTHYCIPFFYYCLSYPYG